MIPFNKPYLTGQESNFIIDAVNSGHLSGNGKYTKKCHEFFEQTYGFGKCLLTSSCTDALEMAAILVDIQPGDEVIMPSYTFVSTANAFILRGAKIIFVDSQKEHPNMDEDLIEALITPKTKAIVPVHYSGFACNMDKIMAIANKYNILVVEDAAQAVDNYYIQPNGTKRALGSIGHLAAFSFHETKNLISGEGGMLAINDERFKKRAEIIWEKGTNRSAYFKGEIDKYGWVDIGSSFLPSEIVAAFLWAQITCIQQIQEKRMLIWNKYYAGLKDWAESNGVKLPLVKDYATNNAHLFYLVCNSIQQRTELIKLMRDNDILAVFHYLSLHKSPFYKDKYEGGELTNTDHYADCLVRLPLFYELGDEQLDRIITLLVNYQFQSK